MSKILSDKVFVKEYELATNEHILDFFRGTIKFCADLLLSHPFSFLAVLAIIISKTEDILIFALILILFSTPLFILSIFFHLSIFSSVFAPQAHHFHVNFHSITASSHHNSSITVNFRRASAHFPQAWPPANTPAQ